MRLRSVNVEPATKGTAMAAQTDRTQYGPHQFAVRLGLTRWQLRVGLEHGVLPGPDLDDGRWSAGLAEKAREAGREVIARFGDDPPVGSSRAAARLAARVSLDVERRDVEVLVAQGALDVVSTFRGHPVYLLRDLDALDPEAVRAVVSTRKGPLMDSVDTGGAMAILGWPRRTFDRVASERGLATDRLGRYALADIQALRADDRLAGEIAEEKRHLALARKREAESHAEDVARGWMLRCFAYVDGDAEQPPDIGVMSRALRNLRALRAELAGRREAAAC
ncbi:hypothetical protein SAMN05443665_103154 [Actinomadura meyerae]|uniref:Uncharacterized protein n=2 Tax=Actinomadura meyerae TaxID=240840 RepID=A0A239MRP7_9ACTN|nr:hypothetical protein SAMN05443665_103154 [Actinomadura meyerae]